MNKSVLPLPRFSPFVQQHLRGCAGSGKHSPPRPTWRIDSSARRQTRYRPSNDAEGYHTISLNTPLCKRSIEQHYTYIIYLYHIYLYLYSYISQRRCCRPSSLLQINSPRGSLTTELPFAVKWWQWNDAKILFCIEYLNSFFFGKFFCKVTCIQFSPTAWNLYIFKARSTFL